MWNLRRFLATGFADTESGTKKIDNPYPKLVKGKVFKTTGISAMAGTKDTDRDRKGRLNNAGGASNPDSYVKLLADGQKMWFGDTNKPLRKLSFPKKVDGMNFTLYNSAGTKDPVGGSAPADSDYNLPANAWCYHITRAAKVYQEAKCRPVKIVVLDDDGGTEKTKSWKSHWAVLGNRDYQDAFAGTGSKNTNQYQGYIIAVKWRWKGAHTPDKTDAEVWKKWSVDDVVTNPAAKPAQITVTLYKDPGTKSDKSDDVAVSKYKNIVLNSKNNWHCVATDLDKYNTEGSYKPDDEAEAQNKLINYTWQEVQGSVKYNGKDFGSVIKEVTYGSSQASVDDDSSSGGTVITNWTPTPTIKTTAINTQTGMKASPEGSTSKTDTVDLTNLYPKH